MRYTRVPSNIGKPNLKWCFIIEYFHINNLIFPLIKGFSVDYLPQVQIDNLSLEVHNELIKCSQEKLDLYGLAVTTIKFFLPKPHRIVQKQFSKIMEDSV